MLLVEGPFRLPVRAGWPLHQSLAALREEAAANGMTDRLPPMTFKADPVVGVMEENVMISVHQLVADGILCPVGRGWEATLNVVEKTRLRPYRRLLMGLEPELAVLIYRAGSNWAALALTAEKNWAKALESVARRRASATPKRRHGPLGAVR